MISKIQSSTVKINPVFVPGSLKSGKLILADFVHELIRDAWKTFRTSLHEQAKLSKETHEAKGEKRKLLEGARRIIEDTHIRRQASHLHLYDGVYLNTSRHLHFQI